MRTYLPVIVALLLAPAVPAKAQPGTIPLQHCQVSPIQEADVPAQQAGVLRTVDVKAGASVNEGDLLAQIDDNHAMSQLAVMKNKLAVANEQAENDINVRYSEAAYLVAKAEYESALEANRNVPGTVPHMQVQELKLAAHRNWLGIEQAQTDQQIAVLQVGVSQAELGAAEENVARHKIKAPLTGEVMKVYSHKGEWVQPGDVVARVVWLQRLYVEGFASIAQVAPSQLKNRTVEVVATLDNNRQVPFRGKIVFAKSLIEGGGKYLVRAEVDNRLEGDQWLLLPGMPVGMTIYMQQPAR